MSGTAIYAFLLRLHRCLALLLFFFMAVFGITGMILQGIILAVGEVKVGGGGLPAYITPFHNFLYMLHTGGMLGFKGDIYGVLCGAGLLYFSVSGLIIYISTYVRRRALGRRSPFWQSHACPEKAWRTTHRWLGATVGFFMLLYGFTGTSLNLDYIKAGTFAGGPPPKHGPRGPPGGQWHEFNYYVHKLDFLGTFGHIFGLLAGVALAMFALSGLVMYVRMYAARRARRKTGLLW